MLRQLEGAAVFPVKLLERMILLCGRKGISDLGPRRAQYLMTRDIDRAAVTPDQDRQRPREALIYEPNLHAEIGPYGE